MNNCVQCGRETFFINEKELCEKCDSIYDQCEHCAEIYSIVDFNDGICSDCLLDQQQNTMEQYNDRD